MITDTSITCKCENGIIIAIDEKFVAIHDECQNQIDIPIEHLDAFIADLVEFRKRLNMLQRKGDN
jgi:hypothetical protein